MENPDQPVPPAGKHFGFNGGYQPDNDTSPLQSLAAMDATGADVLRHLAGWSQFGPEVSATEPVPLDFSSPLGAAPLWSRTASWDTRYLDLTAQGITPIMVVSRVPIWASTLHKCADAMYRMRHNSECPAGWDTWHNYFPAPEYYAQWRQFAAAVATRYPLAIIEGQNEPYNFWNQHQKHPETYPNAVSSSVAADIQCQLYGAVKRVDPSRTVLSMAMFDVPYERRFIREAIDGAGRRCYDVLSFHAYPEGKTSFGANSIIARDMAQIRAARTDAGDVTPIWITETGYTFAPATSTDPDGQEQVYADASRRLYNRFQTMPDVYAVLFNTLRDQALENYKDPTRPERHYGFFYEDWTPKRRACEFVRISGGSYLGCPFPSG
jgi:hypothetical protein